MKNKIMVIIGLVLVVGGAVFSAFSDVPVAEFIGLAVAAAGTGLACVGVYQKSEKKDWKVIVAMVLIVAGAFLLGLAGISTSLVTELLTAVFGIIALIVGIITAINIKKN